MTLASSPFTRVRPADILPPFKRNAAYRFGGLRFWTAMAGLVLFCVLYGSLWAFFAPYLVTPFFIPPAILLLLAVWALPETGRPPAQLLSKLLFAFLVSLIVWPNYLAIAIPGLPWITVIRLTAFPMAFTFLLCLSLSGEFRSRLREAMTGSPLTWKLVLGFAVICFITIPLSDKPMFSLQKVIIYQVTWTCVFFVSCFVFLTPGRAYRWALILWGLALLLGCLAVWEYHLKQVPWLNHIPKFLQIDDPSVKRTLQGSMRAWTNRYRVQGPFSTALGMSEFTGLTLPFVLHFITARGPMLLRIAAAASAVFLVVVAILTGSRSGMIAVLLALLIHTLLVATHAWRHRKDSILGPAVSLAYPAIFCFVVAASVFVGRIRALVIGDGSQDASNQARIDMYNQGIPKIFGAPWGHGAGMGAEALGYYIYGLLTIDSYYLCVALEYGVIGFLVYYTLILQAAFVSGRAAFRDDSGDKDLALLGPLSSAMIIFFVIKSIFSEQDNHPLVFMMLGLIVALMYRYKKGEAQAQSQSQTQTPGPAVRRLT